MRFISLQPEGKKVHYTFGFYYICNFIVFSFSVQCQLLDVLFFCLSNTAVSKTQNVA